MGIWCYVDPGPNNEPVEHCFTEERILDAYYNWWAEQMIQAGKLPMITEQNCLEDWVIVNWAWRRD